MHWGHSKLSQHRFTGKCDRQSRDLTQFTYITDHHVRTHTWEDIAQNIFLSSTWHRSQIPYHPNRTNSLRLFCRRKAIFRIVRHNINVFDLVRIQIIDQLMQSANNVTSASKNSRCRVWYSICHVKFTKQVFTRYRNSCLSKKLKRLTQQNHKYSK